MAEQFVLRRVRPLGSGLPQAGSIPGEAKTNGAECTIRAVRFLLIHSPHLLRLRKFIP